MLKTGDKIKYVKENPMLGIPLNMVFTITNINGTVITLEGEMEYWGINGIARCLMSYDEYAKYFEQVVEPEVVKEKKPEWTEWREITYKEKKTIKDFLQKYKHFFIIGYIRDYFEHTCWKIETRNNKRKTELRIVNAITDACLIKTTAYCNKEDEFDEAVGINVAFIKAVTKWFKDLSDDFIKTAF